MPVEVTLARLAERTSARVPTTPEEARRLHEAGAQRAANQPFDAAIDTAGPDAGAVDELVRLLPDRAERGQAD